jgi:MOSC domain-containing protein YiiM
MAGEGTLPAGWVLSIQIGAVAPLTPRGVASGFVKHAVAGPVAVGELGLEGDEQADRRVHGGPDKAVYVYAAESYRLWRRTHPRHDALWRPGGVGENITVEGVTEEDLCIGDVLSVGAVVLQVTEERQPCFKFAARFGDRKLPKAMIENGRSGWYCRVLMPGRLESGAAIAVTARLDGGRRLGKPG